MFKGHLDDVNFTKGKGCPKCNHTGFMDRIGIFELFYVDDELQDMVQGDALLSEIMKKAIDKGMVPLTHDGVKKVQQNTTSLDELIPPLRRFGRDLLLR